MYLPKRSLTEVECFLFFLSWNPCASLVTCSGDVHNIWMWIFSIELSEMAITDYNWKHLLHFIFFIETFIYTWRDWNCINSSKNKLTKSTLWPHTKSNADWSWFEFFSFSLSLIISGADREMCLSPLQFSELQYPEINLNA